MHSKVAFRSDWHASGSSSVWFFKHSDGRWPCLRTQSECSRQSLSASRRCVQEEDMDRRQGVRSESADSRRGLWLRARPGSPRARSAALPWRLTMPLPPVLRSLVRRTPTVAHVPNRALISVTGSQAAEFLNGLTAASVPGHPQSHFYTAFLHAQVCCPLACSKLLLT